MERQVQFADRQETQAKDFNNAQLFTDLALQHIIMDAITTERMITGLTVTAPEATKIKVAAGRLWDGPEGKIYLKSSDETISLFSYLPVSDQKWVAVSTIGEEIETDMQPRDYLIDIETGQTEPRTVAMEKLRQAAINITAGIESPDPQKPEVPTGYTLIAYVRLTTAGVAEIEMAENKALMRLFDVNQDVKALLLWKELISARVSSLASDLADLYQRIKGIGYQDMIRELARDVGTLKDLLKLPDSYSSYGADNFLDDSESDTGNVDFKALVEEGARFPWAGQTEQQPALFNQYDTAVKDHSGLILPAYNEVVRLATKGFAGAMQISQYQFQTHTMKVGQRTRERIRYGPVREVCSNTQDYHWLENKGLGNLEWKGGGGINIKNRWGEHNGYHWYRIQRYWRETVTENYVYIDTEDHVINGAQICQTFLNSQNGWLVGCNVYLAGTAATGDLDLSILETDMGKPDPSRCLGWTSEAAADLVKLPGKVELRFGQPIFLTAGKHFGLALTTEGGHQAALVDGTQYTNGGIFQSTDGNYFAHTDFSKDLMFELVFAQFTNPHTEVELATLSLAEGIADLDLLLEAVIPQSTDFVIEYQKEGSGQWFPVVPETAGELLGLPAMLHLRAVFNGAQDLMPGLYLPGSKFRAARPGDDFKHISVSRVLGSASEDIDVVLRLEAWDAKKHACTVKLLCGGNTYTHDSVSDEDITDADVTTIRRTVNFKPRPGTGISDFQVQVEGATTNPLVVFHVARSMYVAK